LDLQIREQTDSGKPTVVAEPDGDLTVRYRQIARRVGASIARAARQDPKKIPNIVFE
jgi:ATP-binding protein involved in chromosome partitioning